MMGWGIDTTHDLQLYKPGYTTICRWPHAWLVYRGLNADQSVATFMPDPRNQMGSVHVFKRLQLKALVSVPPVMIQRGPVINDSGLPGLHINDQKDEITFDWKGMFTRLLGEEHVFNIVSAQKLAWKLDPLGAELDIQEAHRKIARKSSVGWIDATNRDFQQDEADISVRLKRDLIPTLWTTMLLVSTTHCIECTDSDVNITKPSQLKSQNIASDRIPI